MRCARMSGNHALMKIIEEVKKGSSNHGCLLKGPANRELDWQNGYAEFSFGWRLECCQRCVDTSRISLRGMKRGFQISRGSPDRAVSSRGTGWSTTERYVWD